MRSNINLYKNSLFNFNRDEYRGDEQMENLMKSHLVIEHSNSKRNRSIYEYEDNVVSVMVS